VDTPARCAALELVDPNEEVPPKAEPEDDNWAPGTSVVEWAILLAFLLVVIIWLALGPFFRPRR
jgi:hypothetical protein